MSTAHDDRAWAERLASRDDNREPIAGLSLADRMKLDAFRASQAAAADGAGDSSPDGGGIASRATTTDAPATPEAPQVSARDAWIAGMQCDCGQDPVAPAPKPAPMSGRDSWIAKQQCGYPRPTMPPKVAPRRLF